MKELDAVILQEDVGKGKEGNIACIIEIFNHGESYLIEVFDEVGDSLGIESVKHSQIELYID